MLSKTTLHQNIWVPRKHRTPDLEAHNLTINVFKTWDTLYRQKKLGI